MKRKAIISMVLSCSLFTLSFANTPAKKNAIIIPDALKTSAVTFAKNANLIDSSVAQSLLKTDAIQQCFDAFTQNGYKPSAAVNRLAEISVEEGYYPNTASAKRVIKANLEACRKDNGLWHKLYSLLGL